VVPERPPFAAVSVWALIGAGFVALYAYLMLRWVTGPNFRSVPAGPDTPPLWMKIVAHSIEVITPLVFLWTLVQFVIKPWRREGEISSDGLMVLALITLYWQNTLPNYLSYGTLLSSAFTNFGSWYQYIPGWLSPNMRRLPEAPIAWGLCYACWFVFLPMKAGAKFTHWFGRRHPALSAARIFLAAYAGFMLLDFVLEGTFLRTGMYAYAGTIHSVTLFAGHTYQFPIPEILTWGLAWTVYATIYAYRDDKGMTIVERGIDKLRVGRKRQKLMRFLALVAVFNLVFLAQNAIMIVIATHADRWPTGYKSYLVNGICGPHSSYDCSAPNVLIPKQTTPTNRTIARNR
jgi:Spirocyclase AveC-like